LYVMAYTAGRGWIEYLRIDEANHILGLRLNIWTSVVVFVAALLFFLWSARRHPGREAEVEPGQRHAVQAEDQQAEDQQTEDHAAEDHAAEDQEAKDEQADDEQAEDEQTEDEFTEQPTRESTDTSDR
ncbi:MAG: prolipoprotein diacylglyceryl transferase family protein, partial [Nocardioidaceae bacterium]